jgi:hypothetical protein
MGVANICWRLFINSEGGDISLLIATDNCSRCFLWRAELLAVAGTIVESKRPNTKLVN